MLTAMLIFIATLMKHLLSYGPLYKKLYKSNCKTRIISGWVHESVVKQPLKMQQFNQTQKHGRRDE